MDKYAHTSSVSGWPVDSKGAPIYALKQMMGPKKCQLIAPTSGGVRRAASATVNSRCVAEAPGLLDTSAAETRLGWWWVWPALCTSGVWIGPGESMASLALAGRGLGAGLPCKVLPLSWLALLSSPAISLWEFYQFCSHHTYKMGLEYNSEGCLSSAVCSKDVHLQRHANSCAFSLCVVLERSYGYPKNPV